MYPPAYPHDPITQIYPDVFLVHGSIKMGPGLSLNRNMIILKEKEVLTLINPVRMNDSELSVLDSMGKVKNIIRLGDFHGLDDQFYLDRYECDFWCQTGQGTYKTPIPTIIIDQNTKTPISNAVFFIFKTSIYPEAAIYLSNYKLLITTDAIQYYSGWTYTTLLTRFVFKLLGFKIGMNIGKPWVKRVTPKGVSLKNDFQELLKLDFDALIAAHGTLLKEGAKKQVKAQMNILFK